MAKWGNIPMNIPTMMNVVTTQRRRCHTNISMNTSIIMNILFSQLCTSCSFDSLGLARNEPTPGKHPHGDSTPKVLSFFCGNMVIVREFMAD